MHRTYWLRVIQISLTLMLIGWLVTRADWVGIRAAIHDVRWIWLSSATLLVLISHLINIVRWRLLVLPDLVSFGSILSYYSAGIFSNNFLPTGIGGDGVRIVLIRRHIGVRRAIWTVAADRALGLLGLISFGLPGLWFGPPPMVSELARNVTANQLAGVIGVVLRGAVGLIALCWRAPSMRERAVAVVRRLLPASDGAVDPSAPNWTRTILGCYGLSILSALCLVLTHSCALLAFDLHISAGAAIWLVVLGSLSMLVPITVNGLGVMESVYVVVLGYYWVLAPSALSVALFIRVLMIAFSLLGGLLSLGQNWRTDKVGSDAPLP